MDEQATLDASAAVKGAKTSKYVVQRAVAINIDTGGDSVPVGPGDETHATFPLWEDVATVEVPVRSHRKSVVIAALQQLDVKDEDLPQVYRALDADTAEMIPVRLERPEPPPLPPAVRRVG